MTPAFRRLALAAFVLGLAASPAAAAGPDGRPVLVELYTSQGCSSCPPADALLGRLANQPGVIAISLPITYWDMLGWKDTLASEINTRRQKAYAAAMGRGGVYTPQIVVDGAMDVVGSRAGAVEAAIAQRRAAIDSAAALADAAGAFVAARADIARAASVPLPVAPPAPPHGDDPLVTVFVQQAPREMHVEIGGLPDTPGAPNATVWMFHLRSAVSVAIPAGENQGHTITYHNVVGDLKAIGVYRGRPLSLTLPRAAMAGLPHDGLAVVVQQEGYGHVIGAAYVSRPDYYAAQ